MVVIKKAVIPSAPFSFLFDLFDELSSACIKLNELSSKDIYLDYEKHLVGQKAILPLINRTIPIVDYIVLIITSQ
ncbi:hypothetical protein DDP48_08355 [Helicobacter pylori]|nr:hypothetical protein DDP48_08355 [Helicobacter pylori]